MNKPRILNLIGGRLRNLQPIGDDVIRAEQFHDDKPMGVYYFDFSQGVAKPGFDLSGFVQAKVAPDFYRREGSLQWNHYIYFILDPGALQEMRRTERIGEIEANRTFARKYVRDETGLAEEFSQSLGATLQSSEVTQDIASQWVSALSEGGLGRIADTKSDYAPIIRDYLDGKVPAQPAKLLTPALDAERGQFLESVEIARFRPHPVKRHFEFGRVNLIRGVNGTGKTSLLESLEFGICGGHRRDGVTSSNAALNLLFAGDVRPTKCPAASLSIYRARDRAWYGGYYLQGNRLCENFSRFNFFDTDAATRLSLATAGPGIKEALDTLFLGEFANSIETRMRECNVRFLKELKEAQKLTALVTAENKRASEDQQSLKAIKDTRETLGEELGAAAARCNWRKVPQQLKLAELESLQEAVSREADLFATSGQRLSWLGKVSLHTLGREADQLAASIAAHVEQTGLLQENNRKSEELNERIASLDSEILLLERISRYHAEPGAFALQGLGEKIERHRKTHAELRDAGTLLRGADIRPFENSSEPVSDLLTSHRAAIAKRAREEAKLSAQAKEVNARLGRINSVVEEIRGLGRHFCEISPTAKACPLCGAEHRSLLERIESLAEAISGGELSGELSAQTARLKTERTALERAMAALECLREADRLIPAKSPRQSAKSIVAAADSLPDLLATEKELLDTGLATERRLRVAGFSETELQDLLEEAAIEHNLSETRLAKPETTDELLRNRRAKMENVVAERKGIERVEKEGQAKLRAIAAKHFPQQLPERPAVEMQRRQAIASEILALMRSPRRAVTFEERDDLGAIASRLEGFAKSTERLAVALKRIAEKDALEQRVAKVLAESGEKLAKLKPRLERAIRAVDLLESLLGSEFKGKYLHGIQKEHHEKIRRLFLRIHAPREFQDVVLEDRVLLKRVNGQTSEIYEISTGQRAALALSIFLALNSSVHSRAPWLLFDDPIAHVDDLNILSFLDGLRELVLLNDRQVFFATASNRIADLFARKFDFLSDFKDFPLAR